MESFLDTEEHMLPAGTPEPTIPPAPAPATAHLPLQTQPGAQSAASLPQPVVQSHPQRQGTDQHGWSTQAPATAPYSAHYSAGNPQSALPQYAQASTSLLQSSPPSALKPGAPGVAPPFVGHLRPQQGPVSQPLYQSGLQYHSGQGPPLGQQALSQPGAYAGLPQPVRPVQGYQGPVGQTGVQSGFPQYGSQGLLVGQPGILQPYMPASSGGQLAPRPVGQLGMQAGMQAQSGGMPGAFGTFPRQLSHPGAMPGGQAPHSMPGPRPFSQPGMQVQQQLRSPHMRPMANQAYGGVPPGQALGPSSEGKGGVLTRPPGPISAGYQAVGPAPMHVAGVQGQQRKGLPPGSQPISGSSVGVPHIKRPGAPLVDWLAPGSSTPAAQPCAIISDRKVQIDPADKESSMYVLLRRWVRNDPDLAPPNDSTEASGAAAENTLASLKPAVDASPSSAGPTGSAPKQGEEAPATPPPIERPSEHMRNRGSIEELMKAHKDHWLKVRSHHLMRKMKRLDSIQQRLARVIPEPSRRSSSPMLT